MSLIVNNYHKFIEMIHPEGRGNFIDSASKLYPLKYVSIFVHLIYLDAKVVV